MPYVALQQMLDDGKPWGTRAYAKGLYLDELHRRRDRRARRAAGGPPRPRHSEVLILPLGGAIADVADDATAFGGSRSLQYVVAIECKAADEETFVGTGSGSATRGTPCGPAAAHDGAYVNLNAEFAGDSLRDTYGAAKFDRLRTDQGGVRPDERLPAQRQHPARLRCDAGNERRFRLRVLGRRRRSAYPSSSAAPLLRRVGEGGAMTRTVGGPIEELRAAMAGVVFTPEDPDYDQARLLWNADADRRPAVVARCSSARGRRRRAAVRAGGGTGDRRAVRGAQRVGAERGGRRPGRRPQRDAGGHRRPRAEARPGRRRGVDLDLDAATQAHGLAVPTGLVGHTGIGGLTLGGGMGWLTRQAGMACDNVESVEIVVADGGSSRAPTEENADLFWAVRGGGGNFGVVTEFEYRLHEVGPMIQFGFLFWEAERGREALRAIREAVATLPRSCNVLLAGLNAPPAPFVPEEHHLRPGFALVLCGFGDPDEHAQAVDRLRAALPPLVEAVTPMPYTALGQAVRPGQLLGPVLLRDVHAVRGADRRRHRRHGRRTSGAAPPRRPPC